MTVVELLNAKGTSPETLIEIMTTSVAELSGDKTEAEMLEEMQQHLNDETRLAQLRELFQNDPALIREAALAWLADASTDNAKRPAIEGAIRDADRSAPLLEAALVAVVSMYAMYLITTGGRTKRTLKIERKADGSYTQQETTEYSGFSDVLKGVVNLFKAGVGKAARPEKDTDSK